VSASRAIVILVPRTDCRYGRLESLFPTMSGPANKPLNALMRHTRSSAGIDERVAILQDLERPACRRQQMVD